MAWIQLFHIYNVTEKLSTQAAGSLRQQWDAAV
jgi:hypothetical protein